MIFAIQRLNKSVRASLVPHFLALPRRDRSMRFGAALAPTVIAAYVDGIDFDRDAVFGFHDNRLALVAAAHVAFADDRVEVGLSVLPAHRRCGIGGALFKRAIAHARSRRIPRLFMQFLSANAPIMRIAQRFGMNIVIGAGGIADAHLNLPPASPAAIAGEIVTDIFAVCHRVLKASVAA